MLTVPQTLEENQLPIFEEALETLLTEDANAVAWQTGFTRRRSPITGAVFAQSLLFGWLARPDASYSQLQQVMEIIDCDVTAQALERRMTEKGADFLLHLLHLMLGICAEHEGVLTELLQRFNGVYLQDGTVIGLPESLKGLWQGSGGNTAHSNRAGLRVQVRLNLSTGAIAGLCLQEARSSERSSPCDLEQLPLPKGALWLVDAGYFALKTMRQMQQEGQQWLTHARADVCVQDSRGVRYAQVSDFVTARKGKGVIDEWVTLGAKERLRCRIIAFPLSEETEAKRRARVNQSRKIRPRGCRRDVRVGKKKQRPSIYCAKRDTTGKQRQALMGWTVLFTNVAEEVLSPLEARILARARWQIELLWRLWKERGQLDIWRSEKPMRIVCEIYAKLMGLILQQWLTLQGCWSNPHRSLVKASMAVQMLAPAFVLALTGLFPFHALFEVNGRMMRRASLNSRRKRPNTSQLLTEPACWKEGLS